MSAPMPRSTLKKPKKLPAETQPVPRPKNDRHGQSSSSSIPQDPGDSPGSPPEASTVKTSNQPKSGTKKIQQRVDDDDSVFPMKSRLGNFLLIYIWNFHVLSHLLIIYICKLHWNWQVKARKKTSNETIGMFIIFIYYFWYLVLYNVIINIFREKGYCWGFSYERRSRKDEGRRNCFWVKV